MIRFCPGNAVKLALLSSLVGTLCLADTPTLPERFGIGRTPDPGEIEKWDIDITPDGKNLPNGQGTIENGERVYVAKCLSCHGPDGKDGINDQLVGEFSADEDLAEDTSLRRTIGNYWPYATTLYDYIYRAMPMNTPGTLSADEVYGLVAYLLYLNGVVPQDTIIDAATLPSIEMPANRLFYWSVEARGLVGEETG